MSHPTPVVIHDLDVQLKRYPLDRERAGRTADWVEGKLSDRVENYRAGTRTQTLFPIHRSDNLRGALPVLGYIDYLALAYANHHGAVLSPDIVWQTLLTELAHVVAGAPDAYRELFTTSPEKQLILVCGDAERPETFVPLLLDHLRQLVPAGAHHFLPEFTTTDVHARLARGAAFCDLVTPYYSYGIYCCGFPWIKVLGGPEDWVKLADAWAQLGKLCHGRHSVEAATWHKRSLAVLRYLVEGKMTWATMFTTQRCGSGSQVEINGWYTDFFVKLPDLRLPNNLPNGLSRLPYRDLPHHRDMLSVHGVLGANEEPDGTLWPLFGYQVFARLPQETAVPLVSTVN